MLTELFFRIAETLAPLVVVAGIGAWYGRRFKLDFSTANMVNMDVCIPALVFTVMVSGDFDLAEMGQMMTATAALILLCGGLAWAVARAFDWPVTAFVPAQMFRNAGNIGIPLAVFAFGEKALAPAAAVFMVENVMHFAIGTRMLSAKARILDVFKVPVVCAAILAISLNLMEVRLPEVALAPLEMLGQCAIPLMLFALGVRLQSADLRGWRIGLGAGIAAPVLGVLCFAVIYPFVDLPPLQMAALFAYAWLPPAVINFMFAERFKQYPAKVASIVAISHMVALISLPIMLALAHVYIMPLAD